MTKFRHYKEYYKENLRLAGPIVLSQVGNVLVQFADNAMVGRLGALPLAAVSFGSTVFMFLFIIAVGFTAGLTPLVGEKHVQGGHRENAGYLQNAFWLYMLMGIVLWAVMLAIVPLMYRLDQPAEVVEMAVPYYKYMAWSVLPFMLFAALKQFLEGLGNTKVAMAVIITANLVNILLNWIFIYGNLGAPALGAEGAGLASLISRMLMPLLLVFYFSRQERFRRYFAFFRKTAFSMRQAYDLMRMGTPIALQMFMECGAFCISAVMAGWIGTVEIASNQVAVQIANITFMMVLGVSAATTIRISHEFGSGNLRRLNRAANASYHIVLLYNAITALLIITMRRWLVAAITPDPQVIEVASGLLVMVAIFQLSDGLQAISVGILRGMQDVKSIMLIAFISYIAINIPVGYLCAFVLGWGATGLWVGFIVGLTVAAILLGSRYRRHYLNLRRASLAYRR